MLIGILQTGHFPDRLQSASGDYDAMFARLLDGHGFDFRAWSVVDGVFPDGPADADGWIITGSRHGCYEDHPWIPPLEALIRDIRDAGRPLVGICFGHQIVAQALGGRVEKSDRGWQVGRTVYDWDGDEMALPAWHQDQVVTLPEGAEVIATHADCPYAALAIGPSILTIQAHPEFGRDVVGGLLAERAPGVVPDDLIAKAEASLDMADDRGRAADRIAAFLKVAHG